MVVEKCHFRLESTALLTPFGYPSVKLAPLILTYQTLASLDSSKFETSKQSFVDYISQTVDNVRTLA